MDEMIFRTRNTRNRLMLELMARGGMRVGEVLKITPQNFGDRKVIIRDPKSGRDQEVVFIPQKLADRFKGYVQDKGIELYLGKVSDLEATRWIDNLHA